LHLQERSQFLVTLGPKLPGFVRSLAGWLLDTFVQKGIYEKLFYQEVWDKQRFDAIIVLVQAVPSILHGGCATLSPLAAATILYNIVDSPVGIVPVTRVDPSKDQLNDAWFQGPGHGSKLYERELFEGKNPVYDPKKMENIPIGVQIVGKRWEEEKVIGMMYVVDQALGPRGFGPGSSLQTKP